MAIGNSIKRGDIQLSESVFFFQKLEPRDIAVECRIVRSSDRIETFDIVLERTTDIVLV